MPDRTPLVQMTRPPEEVYAAARQAMVQRERTSGLPADGPYPATLDEVAEAITDAVWELAAEHFPPAALRSACDVLDRIVDDYPISVGVAAGITGDFGQWAVDQARRAEGGADAVQGPASAADLPDGSVVARGKTAWIKADQSSRPWNGTDAHCYSDALIDEELAADATVLRVGTGQ